MLSVSNVVFYHFTVGLLLPVGHSNLDSTWTNPMCLGLALDSSYLHSEYQKIANFSDLMSSFIFIYSKVS